ncbi:hypothetical protein ABTF32_19385, partial [Acinetobacter baumannii]
MQQTSISQCLLLNGTVAAALLHPFVYLPHQQLLTAAAAAAATASIATAAAAAASASIECLANL